MRKPPRLSSRWTDEKYFRFCLIGDIIVAIKRFAAIRHIYLKHKIGSAERTAMLGLRVGSHQFSRRPPCPSIFAHEFLARRTTAGTFIAYPALDGSQLHFSCS